MRLLKGAKIAVILKIILVTFSLTVLGFLMQASLLAGDIQIGIFFGIAMVLIAIVYFTRVSIPMKFFLPGILLLVTFVVTPVIYTISMSGYKFQTGNVLSKPEALEKLQREDAFAQVPGEKQFDLQLGWCEEEYGDAKDVANAPICALVSYFPDDVYFLSTATTYTPLSKDRITFNLLGLPSGLTKVGAKSTWEPFSEEDYSAFDETITSTNFQFNKPGTFLRAEGYDVMSVYAARLVYDSQADSFTDLDTGFVYKDNGRGNYANTENPEDLKYPGWRELIGLENFVNLVNDPSIREPLVAVFIWTIIFAVTTVVTQYALGLLIGLTLNLKLRGRWLYRSILILPFAMPSVMSIMIWGGILNTDFGAINNLISLIAGQPVKLDWLTDPTLARTSVLLVNLWLGFPYFYLISTGALQAIPQELTEAASIDGASGGQAFRKITFPLLQQMLAPLLIASFAFNFNNFNLIYLLTGGGPKDTLAGDSAGATDILISYTYNLAFNTGGNQNFGLASAVSIVIFIIVAAISLYGIKRSKVLESFT